MSQIFDAEQEGTWDDDIERDVGQHFLAKKEVLAIIPARSGSKGVKNKNVRKLNGLPLIAYSIRVAKRSNLVTRVVVSTDDASIARVAREFGAETPFLRPSELSTDTALVGKCVEHALGVLLEQRYVPDATVVLYPTSPFRSSGMVDYLVGKMLEGYSPVRVVKPIDLRSEQFVSMGQGGRVKALQPIQDDATGADCMRYRGSGLFDGALFRKRTKPYMYVAKNPINHIDIDTEDDLALAEEIISQNLFDFEWSDS